MTKDPEVLPKSNEVIIYAMKADTKNASFIMIISQKLMKYK